MAGTNKFLGTSGSKQDVSNGTVKLYGASIGAINLKPSSAVKTNSQNQLISSKLFISDIENLQVKLNSSISNPFSGLLKVSDLETSNYLSLNSELKQIEHITNKSSEPNITEINGSLVVNDIKTNTISDSGGNIFLNLDNTDVNFSATNLTFNGNDIVSNPYDGNLKANQFIKSGGTNLQYLMADGSVLTNSGGSGGNSNIYKYLNSTSNFVSPMSAGLVQFDNPNNTLATKLYISSITTDNVNIDAYLDFINSISVIYLQDKTNVANYIKYSAGNKNHIQNNYIEIDINFLSGSGTGLTNFTDLKPLILSIFTDSGEVDSRITALESKTAFQSVDAETTYIKSDINLEKHNIISIGPTGYDLNQSLTDLTNKTIHINADADGTTFSNNIITPNTINTGKLYVNDVNGLGTMLIDGSFLFLNPTTVGVNNQSLLSDGAGSMKWGDIVVNPALSDINLDKHNITNVGPNGYDLNTSLTDLKSKTQNITAIPALTTFANNITTLATINSGKLNVNDVNGFTVKLADNGYLSLNPATVGVNNQSLLSNGTGSTKWGNVLANPALSGLNMSSLNITNVGATNHNLDTSLTDLKNKTQYITTATGQTLINSPIVAYFNVNINGPLSLFQNLNMNNTDIGNIGPTGHNLDASLTSLKSKTQNITATTTLTTFANNITTLATTNTGKLNVNDVNGFTVKLTDNSYISLNPTTVGVVNQALLSVGTGSTKWGTVLNNPALSVLSMGMNNIINIGSGNFDLDASLTDLKSKTQNITATTALTTFANNITTLATTNSGKLYVNDVNGFGVKLADNGYLLLNPTTVGVVNQALLSVGTGSTKWGTVLANPALSSLNMSALNITNVGATNHDLDTSLTLLKKKTQGIDGINTDAITTIITNRLLITNTDNNVYAGITSFKTNGSIHAMGEILTPGRVIADTALTTAGYVYAGSVLDATAVGDSAFSTRGGAWIEKSLKVIGAAGVRALKYVIPGGLSSEFLKADGSLDARRVMTGNAVMITPPAVYSNSAVETDIVIQSLCVGSLTIPANFIIAGTTSVGNIKGRIGSELPGTTITFRIYGGSGTTLLSSTVLSLPNMGLSVFNLETLLTVRSITSGTGSFVISTNFTCHAVASTSQQFLSTGTINTTISNTFRITAQWGAAKTQNVLQDILYNSYTIY